ncbi:hypothetical protein [Mucilaginibacter arboris]|uniref:Uncharacterized protein n=1 Tax=Mucilaginibacter arboris TaxID=2682090 RepID=A0A7K1SYQ3_9SPHI|nr:hypothetical protein [Mucilaginibacter arboris]MVN22456.1 hypothetical protein [Mucilaginibacter arboris]
MRKLLFILLIILGFLSCKRSIHQQTPPEYDTNLVHTLRKLEQRYADKKVRINTWDKKADAYQDIPVLDDDQQITGTLTIGDSVKFIAIDLGQPDGIRAAIKLPDNKTGYIQYWKIEEFEPAARIDPDLKN